MNKQTYLKIEKKDGIAVIRIDNPGEKVNTLNKTFLDEIESSMKFVNEENDVKGAVFISTKPGCFIAGADIKILQEASNIEMGERISRLGQRAFQAIEDCKKPVVAAIDGSCLGGGAELALACHYLLASDNPKTVIACPEIMLGLFPAGGAPQRLPKRVSIRKSLDLMLTGKNVRAREAKSMGLVDDVVCRWGFEATAVDTVNALIEGKIKKAGKKMSARDKILEGNPAGRSLLFHQARSMIRKKTRGLYPAPFAVIDSVETGLSKGNAEGYRTEIRKFGELTQTPQAKSLISLYSGNSKLKKNPFEKPKTKDLKLGILGAGQMGAGIGLVSLLNGKEVVLKDISNEGLGKGKKVIWDELNKRSRKKAISAFERDRLMAKVHTQKDVVGFENLDFIVEAVFEDIGLKHRVIAEAESKVKERCVIATNTSAIPIAEVAAKSKRPQNIVGMHYFSPVNRMPLLEVVRHPGNTEEAVSRAVQMGLDQGKTVIVVKDSPGFYTTRVLASLMDEAVLLLQEGVEIHRLDSLMKDFGFPVGPITLFDEVGIDTAAHIADFLAARIGKKPGAARAPLLNEMAAAGLHGRKSGKGFFLYEEKPRNVLGKLFRARKKKVNQQALEFIEKHRLSSNGEKPGEKPDDETIQRRLAYRFTNEAIRCFEEGILSSPVDGDVGAVMGLGFPPILGGPFRWVDQTGLQSFQAGLAHLEKTCGERFEAPALLNKRIIENGTFHG
ncbi:MAG: enoyl-CoA hydratase/isomerase family protein [Deltaproteobacteria bacterium]|nr:enoyl-CoA hydratase/isomerase family protein [Deltaproteobacteria bacterium]